MSEPKYTPGPWDDISSDVPNSVRIFARNQFVAFVGSSDEDHEQTLANAHLIAAAPEMLAALKAAIGPCDDYDATEAMITAAIAKAEGRKS